MVSQLAISQWKESVGWDGEYFNLQQRQQSLYDYQISIIFY